MKHILLIVLLVLLGLLVFSFATRNTTEEVGESGRAETTSPVIETVPEDYIGMTMAQASAKAEADGVPIRVVEIDGQPQPTTRDFRPGRVSVMIEGGLVVDYTVETETPVVSAPEPGEPDTPHEADPDVIIGMTVAEAEAYAATANVPFRIGVLDGEFMALTMDYRPGRITAEVENDVVVGYSIE